MTAQTANRKYTYPITSDRPQDAPLTLAQMVTTQLEPDLLYLDNEYKRFARFPLAMVEYNGGGQRIDQSTSIPFDTVLEDTWGSMVNLGKDPTLITSPPEVPPGLYLLGAYARFTNAGGTGAGAATTLQMSSTWFYNGFGSNNWETDGGMTVWGYGESSATSLCKAYVTPTFTGTNANNYITCTYARMWMIWFADK